MQHVPIGDGRRRAQIPDLSATMFLQKFALGFVTARSVFPERRQRQMPATDGAVEKQRTDPAILAIKEIHDLQLGIGLIWRRCPYTGDRRPACHGRRDADQVIRFRTRKDCRDHYTSRQQLIERNQPVCGHSRSQPVPSTVKDRTSNFIVTTAIKQNDSHDIFVQYF
jgi:hypothetical protein